MKKFFKFIGILFLVLIVALVGGGYYFIKNFDLNKYKSYAEDLVYKETGRKLALNGEADLGISLVPTLVLNDVSLSNASWASQPQMLKVKQLEISFAVLPLLHKEIMINNINLVAPEIYLEQNAAGQANWEFGKPADGETAAVKAAEAELPQAAERVKTAEKAGPAAAVLAGFAAKNVSIENGLVRFSDQKAKQTVNLQINSFNFSADGMDAPITADFDLLYDNQPIKGNTVLGSINQFLAAAEPFPVKLTAGAYGVNVNADGTVADMMKNPVFDFKANIYNPAGNFDAPETTLAAKISGDIKKVKADISTLNVANNLITGTVTADLNGKKPLINANLSSDRFDLTSLNRAQPLAWNLPGIIGEAQASQLVPNTPVPYSALNSVNANAAVRVKQLIINPAMTAENVVLTAKLNNGVLTVNPLKLDFGGGDIDASLTVNAPAQTVALKLNSKNILLQNMHKEFQIEGKGDFGIESGGQTLVSADLTTGGATYRQLVQHLNGQLVAIVDKSVIKTGALKFMTGNVLTQILNMINLNVVKNPEINLACAVVRADFANGKANFPQSIAVQSNQITLVSNGALNLVSDKIDFTVTPTLSIKDANVAQALSSFIKVGGTLENPKIALDEKQALQTIVGVATTGPAFLGAQLVSESNSAPCWTALQGTPYSTRFKAPSKTSTVTNDVVSGTKNAVKDTGKAIEKSVRGIRDGVKDLFKSF